MPHVPVGGGGGRNSDLFIVVVQGAKLPETPGFYEI